MLPPAIELVLAIAGIFGFIATLIGAYMIIRSTAIKANAEAQKELIDTLVTDKAIKDGQIQDLQSRQIESSKSLSMLQGRVDVLQTLPLQEISTHMQSMAGEMSTLAGHQHDILALISTRGKSNDAT